MRLWRGGCVLMTVAAMAGAGCGGDDFEPPECGEGEFRYSYSEGGQLHETSASVGNYIFVNKISDDPGQLNLEFGGGGTLTLQWPEAVNNGGSVDARGVLFDDNETFGNCESDGFPGTLIYDGDGVGAFQLVDARPNADCAEAPVIDEIVGCFHAPPR